MSDTNQGLRDWFRGREVATCPECGSRSIHDKSKVLPPPPGFKRAVVRVFQYCNACGLDKVDAEKWADTTDKPRALKLGDNARILTDFGSISGVIMGVDKKRIRINDILDNEHHYVPADALRRWDVRFQVWIFNRKRHDA